MIVLVVFYYGGMMMQNSAITVGEISSFLVYAAYMGFGLGGLISAPTNVTEERVLSLDVLGNSR